MHNLEQYSLRMWRPWNLDTRNFHSQILIYFTVTFKRARQQSRADVTWIRKVWTELWLERNCIWRKDFNVWRSIKLRTKKAQSVQSRTPAVMEMTGARWMKNQFKTLLGLWENVMETGEGIQMWERETYTSEMLREVVPYGKFKGNGLEWNF